MNNNNNSIQQCFSLSLQQQNQQQQILSSNIVQNHYNNLQVLSIPIEYNKQSLDCNNVSTAIIAPTSGNNLNLPQVHQQLEFHHHTLTSSAQQLDQSEILNKNVVDKQENICNMISLLMTYDDKDLTNSNLNNQIQLYQNIQPPNELEQNFFNFQKDNIQNFSKEQQQQFLQQKLINYHNNLKESFHENKNYQNNQYASRLNHQKTFLFPKINSSKLLAPQIGSTIDIPHNINKYTQSTVQYFQNKYFNNHCNQETINFTKLNNFSNKKKTKFFYDLKNNKLQQQSQQKITKKKRQPLKKYFSFILNNKDCDIIVAKTKYYEQKLLPMVENKKHNNNNNFDHRSKTTIVAPKLTTLTNFQNNSVKSLYRFNSMLRKVSNAPSSNFFPKLLLSKKINTLFNSLFTPYTPPPILSPMRSGTGLFNQISIKKTLEYKLNKAVFTDQYINIHKTDNYSENLESNNILSKHQLMVSDVTVNDNNFSKINENDTMQQCSTNASTSNSLLQQSSNSPLQQLNEVNEIDENRLNKKKSSTNNKTKLSTSCIENDKFYYLLKKRRRLQNNKRKKSATYNNFNHTNEIPDLATLPTISNNELNEENDENKSKKPHRKNGLFFSGNVQSSNGSDFTAELEALRKEFASSASNSIYSKTSEFDDLSSQNLHARMNIRNNKLSIANENDFIRKMSLVSMDEMKNCKESCLSDFGVDELVPPETDNVPHINLGKAFQARVKKWADREITLQERAAIADRDELMFDSRVVEHLPQKALAAYETLACSVAIPRPGRNKELALHILMENQGNIQAAVIDLLKSDTLDWEQYPIIYNNLYTDVDNWSSEDINLFQDAIYKSEKDFHQVASELNNRTVKECVSFYYMWKKACPDDYRKLRNLRRKRQLLEQQLDFSSYNTRICMQSEVDVIETSNDDLSDDTESDITNPSFCEDHNAKTSPILQQTDSTTIANNNEQLNKIYSHSDFENFNSYNNVENKQDAIQFNLLPVSEINVSKSIISPNRMEFSPLNVNTTNNALFNNNNNFSYSNSANFQSNTNLNVNNSFPWLHGENSMFPSPCSSSTTSSTIYDASGKSHIVDVSNRINSYNSNNSALSIFSNQTGNVLQSLPCSNKIYNNMPKKGAQPSADGFFHCRLCEKRFEKVKSLNAHMKSHAMKARAEAEVNAELLKKNQCESQTQHEQQKKTQFTSQQQEISNLNKTKLNNINDSIFQKSISNSIDNSISSLNLCQQKQQSAVVAAAALGQLNDNLNLLQSHQNNLTTNQTAVTTAITSILNTQNFVSAAMTHLAAVNENYNTSNPEIKNNNFSQILHQKFLNNNQNNITQHLTPITESQFAQVQHIVAQQQQRTNHFDATTLAAATTLHQLQSNFNPYNFESHVSSTTEAQLPHQQQEQLSTTIIH